MSGGGAGGSGRGGGRGAAGASRVLAKLNASLENGNFYEAHQMYRTLYYRYTAQKKYGEIESMLYEGAVKLFDKDQGGSGADLSKLYLENLTTAESEGAVEASDATRSDQSEQRMRRVVTLFASIPSSLPDKDVFLSQAIKWSSDKRDYPSGHPRLHQLLAYEFWKIKKYPESRHHFLYSFDGRGCGQMLADFHHERGFVREIDLFIVGTVLQYLTLKKHIAAAVALQSYAHKHPKISSSKGGGNPPFKHPLMNFVWLLLLAIEHKQSVAAFTTLIEKYKPSLRRDPMFLEYLDKIGQHFFGVPPPQRGPPPGGMLSGIFDSLLSAFNDDDEDEEGDSDGDARMTSPKRPSTSTTPNKKMSAEDLD